MNLYKPWHGKTNHFGFRPGLTQTELYKNRRWLEAGNFGFRISRKGDVTISVAKPKTLISSAVTAQIICVFAYVDYLFSDAVAHIQ